MSQQDASNPSPARTPRVKRPDRSQIDNPKSIDELIPEDHPSRLVWQLVGELDMSPLYAPIKAVEGAPGRSPIAPEVLIALWMYGTMEGISSARELARRCYDCDAFKWLRGGVDVNHHTLSDFRVNHSQWLKDQVIDNITVMMLEGLIELNQVGQDGMRVRASAGSGSFKRDETLEELRKVAEQQWERLEDEFENGSSEVTARQRAARERAVRERMERIERAIEECKEVRANREKRKKDGNTARASTTDPEARTMKMADGGFRPAYNVQFATTLDSLVIIGDDVTNVGSDGGLMDPMVHQIEVNLGVLPEEYYTDGGFSTKDDIENVGDRGVEVYTPVKEAEKQQRQGKDPYKPRRGDGPNVSEWRERMGTDEAKEKYKQRAKCEWPNAQCRNHGLWQFTVRGLPKVKTVVRWYVLVHNMLRMVALRAEHATSMG